MIVYQLDARLTSAIIIRSQSNYMHSATITKTVGEVLVLCVYVLGSTHVAIYIPGSTCVATCTR